MKAKKILLGILAMGMVLSGCNMNNKTKGGLIGGAGGGALGAGLGAAIGGCIANDRKRTVLFTGDGSFGMCLQELATAVSQPSAQA